MLSTIFFPLFPFGALTMGTTTFLVFIGVSGVPEVVVPNVPRGGLVVGTQFARYSLCLESNVPQSEHRLALERPQVCHASPKGHASTIPQIAQCCLLGHAVFRCSFLHFAQRALCAARIREIAAADNLRVLRALIDTTFCPLTLVLA